MTATQISHKDHFSSPAKKTVCILVENFSVSSNVGSVFRISDALGVKKIYLVGSTPTPPNRKIKQAARSTDQHVPFSYESNSVSLIQRLKKENYKIVSLERTQDSKDIRDHGILPGEKVCLVLGSETKGVPRDLLLVSDLVLHIPMLGVNSSMNVANACAIAVYELMRLSI